MRTILTKMVFELGGGCEPLGANHTSMFADHPALLILMKHTGLLLLQCTKATLGDVSVGRGILMTEVVRSQSMEIATSANHRR